MTVRYRSLSCALALTLAAAAGAAHATPVRWTGSWQELDVTLVTPSEKITQFTPFDLAVEVDSSRRTTGDMVSFGTLLWLSGTVDLSNAYWRYAYATDWVADRLTLDAPLQRLGDGVASSVEARDGGWLIHLFQPGPVFLEGTTTLSAWTHDKVTWDLTNIVIDGDTTVKLSMFDPYTAADPYADSRIVIDPPAVQRTAAVPEPPALALALVALGAGVLTGRRGRGAHRAQRGRSAGEPA